jgi:hypothetical protein
MKENTKENHSQADRDVASTDDTANQPETSNRRELIARYGKVAIVAAPLLMFVSKARAIHSKP